MKKILALLLAALMVVSCAGCSSSSDESGTKADTATEAAESKVPELKGPGNVTIVSVNSNVTFDPNEDSSAPRIEEATGYHVEYEMLPAENATEKLMLEATSGTDWDMVKCNMSQFQKLQASGALLPLNDLLEAYGPDILAGYDESSWAAVSDSAGVIYGIPWETSSYNEIKTFIICRWDLMQAAGITEVPETVQEFYDTCAQLKDYYGDEYIILTGPQKLATYDPWLFPRNITSAFGIWNDWMTDEEGNLHYITEDEGFADLMNYFQSLYKAGFLDPEWAVNTNETVSEKWTSGKAIMCVTGRDACNLNTPVLLETCGITYDDIEYIGMLEGEDGTCEFMPFNGVQNVSVILRSSDCAADVINWNNLKVQNQMYLNFGVEGTHFTRDADGNMEPIQPAFNENYANSYWYCNAMAMRDYQKDWPARLRKSDAQWDCWKRVTLKAQNETPEIYIENPFMYMNAGEAYSSYNAALTSLLNDYVVQVMSGVRTIDDLPSFVSEWKAAGGEEVRAELEAYLSTK